MELRFGDIKLGERPNMAAQGGFEWAAGSAHS